MTEDFFEIIQLSSPVKIIQIPGYAKGRNENDLRELSGRSLTD
jgi:hypothetical protein